MKVRFSSADIRAVIVDIRQKLLGLRVANVYDIDNKTYLIKFVKTDQKHVLLLESGIRLHSTEFEWPKNVTPSGFSMKLRKHLRTRRLESVEQLGVDRIVDLTFGSGEAAYHVIVELYDRGNLVLADFEYNILNILRPRTDQSQDVKFIVREKYPIETAGKEAVVPTEEELTQVLLSAKKEEPLKRILSPFVYGPILIEHCLLESGFPPNSRLGHEVTIEKDLKSLVGVLELAHKLFNQLGQESCKGYITQKTEKKVMGEDTVITYVEFHPYMFKQFAGQDVVEFVSFDKAVDEFYSKLGSQKLDLKVLQQEKAIVKKLENVRKDHERRLENLEQEQTQDKIKAKLIEENLKLVEDAILIIQNALANQIDWTEIGHLVKEAQAAENPVACAIQSLNLQSNQMTMGLRMPVVEDSFSEDEELSDKAIKKKKKANKPVSVLINLGITAYANSKKYYDMKKTAARKEQKTIEASEKALQSANRKTKETLKEMAVTASINKARKTYWFEKFLWFISSENFLVIGGRDMQQNEMIVKKYLRKGDVYMHADIRGATSLVIKNHTGQNIPPKTLNEAASMAVCQSAAWDARVVASAWWVHSHQVSKTAPSGEFLTTGSFMIRGKKNFLPASSLIFGFGFMFKLEDDSVARHKGERCVKVVETTANYDDVENEVPEVKQEVEDVELEMSTDSESENESKPQIDGEGNYSEDEDRPAVDDMNSDAIDDEEEMFPDTTINVQHVGGDKVQLQRGTSHVADETKDTGSEVASKQPPKKAKLTAKQRKLQKKQQQLLKQGVDPEDIEKILNPAKSEGVGSQDEHSSTESKSAKPKEPKDKETQSTQLTRAQRNKKKKMLKYKDQDEDDRAYRMALINPNAAPREDKLKFRAAMKEKALARHERAKAKRNMKMNSTDIRMDLLNIHDPDAPVDKNATPILNDEDDSDDERQAVLDGEKVQVEENINILDTLTGQPHPEDILLFCLPVAAPYSTLTNYKYKVKLTPGTTKRGKAAKTSIGAFLFDKFGTAREKELLRSVKDIDNSRNIPGKVKVSAPNLHASKHK